jgi:hypothetical protein
MPQIITATSLQAFWCYKTLHGIISYETRSCFFPTFGLHCYLVILVWDALYRAYRKLEVI